MLPCNDEPMSGTCCRCGYAGSQQRCSGPDQLSAAERVQLLPEELEHCPCWKDKHEED